MNRSMIPSHYIPLNSVLKVTKESEFVKTFEEFLKFLNWTTVTKYAAYTHSNVSGISFGMETNACFIYLKGVFQLKIKFIDINYWFLNEADKTLIFHKDLGGNMSREYSIRLG